MIVTRIDILYANNEGHASDAPYRYNPADVVAINSPASKYSPVTYSPCNLPQPEMRHFSHRLTLSSRRLRRPNSPTPLWIDFALPCNVVLNMSYRFPRFCQLVFISNWLVELFIATKSPVLPLIFSCMHSLAHLSGDDYFFCLPPTNIIWCRAISLQSWIPCHASIFDQFLTAGRFMILQVLNCSGRLFVFVLLCNTHSTSWVALTMANALM